MAIVVNLDVMMARRKMSLNELSQRVDITLANLSILKNNKARAVRFSTLEAICKALRPLGQGITKGIGSMRSARIGTLELQEQGLDIGRLLRDHPQVMGWFFAPFSKGGSG